MVQLNERMAMKISSLLAVTAFSPAADLAIERAELLVRHYASTLHLMEERRMCAAKTRLIEMARAAEEGDVRTVHR